MGSIGVQLFVRAIAIYSSYVGMVLVVDGVDALLASISEAATESLFDCFCGLLRGSVGVLCLKDSMLVVAFELVDETLMLKKYTTIMTTQSTTIPMIQTNRLRLFFGCVVTFLLSLRFSVVIRLYLQMPNNSDEMTLGLFKNDKCVISSDLQNDKILLLLLTELTRATTELNFTR